MGKNRNNKGSANGKNGTNQGNGSDENNLDNFPYVIQLQRMNEKEHKLLFAGQWTGTIGGDSVQNIVFNEKAKKAKKQLMNAPVASSPVKQRPSTNQPQ